MLMPKIAGVVVAAVAVHRDGRGLHERRDNGTAGGSAQVVDAGLIVPQPGLEHGDAGAVHGSGRCSR